MRIQKTIGLNNVAYAILSQQGRQFNFSSWVCDKLVEEFDPNHQYVYNPAPPHKTSGNRVNALQQSTSHSLLADDGAIDQPIIATELKGNNRKIQIGEATMPQWIQFAINCCSVEDVPLGIVSNWKVCKNTLHPKISFEQFVDGMAQAAETEEYKKRVYEEFTKKGKTPNDWLPVARDQVEFDKNN